ncbi:MAG TPA: HAMP domain-containing sensor histidine kinase [Minicystis sp.]|nr:HAMP domain-containing sensor histidine kinase [Minicystis sp.]
MKQRPTSARWLFVAFSVVVLSFTASTVVSEVAAEQISSLSDSLTHDAMPSIERLSAARTELRHVQSLAHQWVDAQGAPRARVASAIDVANDHIDTDVDAYLRLPVYPGEEQAWAAIRRALSSVDTAVATMRVAVETAPARAAASLAALDAACDHAVDAVSEDIAFNAQNGERLGRRIHEARRRALVAAIALDALCALMTLVVAVAATRAVTSHAALLERHGELLTARADELEQFAGRIAHDVRNPIGAAMVSLSLVQKYAASDEKLVHATARGLSALRRAARLLDGLLDFARAGARPRADGRADVAAVVGPLVEDVADGAGAAAHVEVRCGALEGAVRCEPAILEVLVANLVRNAIKYMGEGAVRTVNVAALEIGDVVRVEVSDTGVGIPRELLAAVFDPFVRGPSEVKEGIGLGLATVKRVCEAHGGRVGVDSVVGRGSRFWFELPTAARGAPSAAPPPA